MRGVVVQDQLFDSAQGGTDGGGLAQDVDAVAVVFDHAGDAAHLPFNPAQAFQGGRFVPVHVCPLTSFELPIP